MRQNLKILLATLFAVAGFSACGYHHESLAHPQIHSVAIGAIDNDSEDPRLAILMNEALKEAVMQDGSFRLVRVEDADVIITGHFGELSQRGVGFHQGSKTTDDDSAKAYRANSYRSQMTFDYQLTTRKDWLIKKTSRSDSADFAEGLDFQSDRREALKVACRRLAGKVIVSLSEGW